MYRKVTPADDGTTVPDLATEVSNLDALMTEVSLAAGRATITVCGHDDGDPELVAIRPLAVQASAQREGVDWQEHTDAVIFAWPVSP